MNNHEDFGEKIGGARKDLWKERDLYVDDLDAMNDREAEKFVKKDNIWKKPDYQAMLDSGLPLGVVFFIKKARDSINASPQYLRGDKTSEKRLARQREYIQTVRELQSVVSEVRTVERDAYFVSEKTYEDCKTAIEESINRHNDGFTFSDGLVEDVLSKFNVERVKNLLAYTVQKKEWDGRFSYSNKAWARSVQTGISEPLGAYLTVESHPTLLDGFINQFRRKVLEQKKEPKAPAKKHWERSSDIEL